MVEIAIPPRSAYVGVVRLALSSLARASGIDEDVVDDLKMAVSEACANAVIAHEEAASQAPVEVTWSQAEDELVIEVRDHVTNPEVSLDPDDQDSQGFSTRLVMSTALLRSLVSRYEVVPAEGGGATTRLTFSL